MYRILIIAALMLPAIAVAADHVVMPFEPGATDRKAALDVKSDETGAEGEWPMVVSPEVTTKIRLSSSDVNRISCSTVIRDALTSTEKGVVIKITGRDAFVKFKVTKRPDKMVYSTTPTELYVVCGDETYSMVAVPQRIPSQTIRLSSGKIRKMKDNAALYAGLPFEKMMLKAIQDVYTEQIPDSYTVTGKDQRFDSYRELRLVLKRVVDVEGEGLRIKEYLVSLKEGTKEFRMNEKMFIRTELVENPVAISIERHVLRPGDTTRAFVVEQRGERQGLSRKLESDLPVVEDTGKRQKTPAKGGEEAADRREAEDEE
ncbi:type-F conjugative transfer system secretin TraK [Geobacter sp. DSM 9736]|uniref:type-F conjugative transfer system secretin TraK n=1 Tax=Geobacter sp. DSM 9736 TaxID=1277350 RepID=UPI000B51218D|nr:type-F conjugative transfer system secretin TraK [Geobacter sp. DSM 9736]SNB45424.1 conjugal transfer pilus assembly protein TraK [Geobacter sp. DSM 9736]